MLGRESIALPDRAEVHGRRRLRLQIGLGDESCSQPVPARGVVRPGPHRDFAGGDAERRRLVVGAVGATERQRTPDIPLAGDLVHGRVQVAGELLVTTCRLEVQAVQHRDLQLGEVRLHSLAGLFRNGRRECHEHSRLVRRATPETRVAGRVRVRFQVGRTGAIRAGEAVRPWAVVRAIGQIARYQRLQGVQAKLRAERPAHLAAGQIDTRRSIEHQIGHELVGQGLHRAVVEHPPDHFHRVLGAGDVVRIRQTQSRVLGERAGERVPPHAIALAGRGGVLRAEASRIQIGRLTVRTAEPVQCLLQAITDDVGVSNEVRLFVVRQRQVEADVAGGARPVAERAF